MCESILACKSGFEIPINPMYKKLHIIQEGHNNEFKCKFTFCKMNIKFIQSLPNVPCDNFKMGRVVNF